MKELAKLRNFAVRSSSDLGAGLNNVASELARGPLSGQLALVVRDTTQRLVLIDLDRPSIEEPSEEADELGRTPDFVVYVHHDTLAEVLRGALSPLQAFLEGRLRYAGKKEVGVAILRELASTQDAVFEPCRETRE